MIVWGRACTCLQRVCRLADLLLITSGPWVDLTIWPTNIKRLYSALMLLLLLHTSLSLVPRSHLVITCDASVAEAVVLVVDYLGARISIVCCKFILHICNILCGLGEVSDQLSSICNIQLLADLQTILDYRASVRLLRISSALLLAALPADSSFIVCIVSAFPEILQLALLVVS